MLPILPAGHRMMRKAPLLASLHHLTLLVLLYTCLPGAARAQPSVPHGVTEVVVLGVDHSAQLVNRHQQPGAMRAFFDAIAPSAICIERSPEKFARNDHYEFTYEIQDLIVPWAREKNLPLCPFDWLPSAEDSALAFGIPDLESVPVLRKEAGFQGFLTFPEPRSRTQGLFFADSAAERDRHREFYAAYPQMPARDFARRLFLYRTFMQAQRIAAAAKNHPGQRILVVVGVMHKDDIEAILAANPQLRIVLPSALVAEPTESTIGKFARIEDYAAIANFNLLGTQWRDPMLDRAWMGQVVGELQKRWPGAETDLYALRLAELNGESLNGVLQKYLAIPVRAADKRFIWTGVKDRSRIDSFFDPFGNLPIASRALLEAARIHLLLGERSEAEAIRSRLDEALDSDFKRLQFQQYWTRYVEPATH